MPTPSSFTGRRRRTTRWSVRLIDRLAQLIIAIGGIGTIIAVSLVCVFLVWVVVPLFLPASVGKPQSLPITADRETESEQSSPLAIGADDYRLAGWIIDQAAIHVFQLDTARSLQELSGAESSLTGITSLSQSIDGQSAAFGFDDGRVRLGQIGFDYQIIPLDEATPDEQKLAIGQTAALEDGRLAARTLQGDIRREKFSLKLQAPLDLSSTAKIVLLDHVVRPNGTRFCTLSADGKVRVHLLAVTHNLVTDEDETQLTSAELPLPKNAITVPDYLLISELGDAVYVAWHDGRLLRFETRNLQKPRLVEDIDLVPETGHALTALKFLLGRNTLISGDTLGRIRAWFTAEAASPGHPSDDLVPLDGRHLVMAHEFPGQGQSVTSIAASPRARLLAAGFANGQVRLLYPAAERMLADLKCTNPASVSALDIAPKGDCVLAATKAGITRWDFDARYPEATLSTLFLPVWYEGRTQGEHVWQSTGSSDSSEAKLGLMPLVFGTLKATLYTMLFGAPLALLAAIYSSEFLHPRLRARVKPTIEMMASLPSVVLGFLAGMVIAPLVEGIVPQVLTCIFTCPLAFLSGAYIWQLLPSNLVVRLSRFRLVFIILLLPVGIFAGIRLGPLVEQWLFAGNIKQWLDMQRGTGLGGWIMLLLPVAALLTLAIFSQKINPWIRQHSYHWTRTRAGLVELLKFVVGVAFTIALAWLVAAALDALKLDPRGAIIGTYVQRNALVVGFAMGFAIIPLIYTIADDALSTVPEHLRSASLGAGATPWQTAVRIVVPTAASGLFSALMIGLGRAVGETMIVLMAAGNTPIMDWNIFQGFETLSMAIATELPEAAKNSTHYRTLFLAALTLFAVTFVVNTVAEIVRQRFRRRAYEL